MYYETQTKALQIHHSKEKSIMCNSCFEGNNCMWIIILLIIFILLFSNCGGGCGCDCGNNNGCGCGC